MTSNARFARTWLHAISFAGLGAMEPDARFDIWHSLRRDDFSPPPEWDWELMALEYAAHARQCTHPLCGRKRLSLNGALIQFSTCTEKELSRMYRMTK